jgi:hypothetical protein
MEKLTGKPIGDAWYDLSEQERLKVLLQIVELETKLFAIKLPASGSIYYARDLHPNTPKIDIPGSDSGLCIGPYDGGLANVEILTSTEVLVSDIFVTSPFDHY